MPDPISSRPFAAIGALLLATDFASPAMAAAPILRPSPTGGVDLVTESLKVMVRMDVDRGEGQWVLLKPTEVVKEGEALRLQVSTPSSATLRKPVHAYGTLRGPSGNCYTLPELVLPPSGEVGWGPMFPTPPHGSTRIDMLLVEGALANDDFTRWLNQVGCRPVGEGGGRHGSNTKSFPLGVSTFTAHGSVEQPHTIAYAFAIKSIGPTDSQPAPHATPNEVEGGRTR